MSEKCKYERQPGIFHYIVIRSFGGLTMNRLERIHKIDEMITRHGLVPVHDFLSTLGISLATFKRDLDYLRSHLHAPVLWDRQSGGYRYGKTASRRKSVPMPRLWLTGQQTHALLTAYRLMSSAHSPYASPDMDGLAARVLALLCERGENPQQVLKRIVLEDASAPQDASPGFEAVASALLNRRRLRVTVPGRGKQAGEHEVSPLRLVLSKAQWRLEGLHHGNGQVGQWALSDLAAVEVLKDKARDRAGR